MCVCVCVYVRTCVRPCVCVLTVLECIVFITSDFRTARVTNMLTMAESAVCPCLKFSV